ncbi:hypothetical protein, partial [Actinacidiphila oryziradicis]|uniref:hypothetical protein n=1 Tax=Actinacidiphila oryziradicis TaxID=2571141 RepID=UPI0023F0992D
PQVAGWLTRHDLPSISHTEPRRPGLSEDEVSFAVVQARRAHRNTWADIAAEGGMSCRHLQLLVQADAIGEDFGWFTEQRRSKAS